jgi:hypothetical protein
MTAARPHNQDTRYRIDRPTFSVIMRDLRLPNDSLGAGDTIPLIDLPTTDGGRFRSDSMAADPRPVLLVFGSLTCPVTESAGHGLPNLHREYGDAVRFVVVYVREPHPGAAIPQPRVLEEKMRNARALQTHHGFTCEVAVDDIDGTVHRAFGTQPSSAYIIDPSGTIVFRAHWSSSVKPLEEALRAVVAGRRPAPASVTQTAHALARMAVYADVSLATAGRGALRDFWRVAPPVAAMINVSRLFRFLPIARRTAPTVAVTLALCAAVVAGVLLALR